MILPHGIGDWPDTDMRFSLGKPERRSASELGAELCSLLATPVQLYKRAGGIRVLIAYRDQLAAIVEREIRHNGRE
jgi:hypothetical protein